MKQTRWFFHPIFVFVLSTVALAISLFLYIYWYIGISAGLTSVVSHYNLDPNEFFEAKTWVVILVMSLLVSVILAGILIILIYNLKTLQLYRLQNTFINNFTHELKTPVTSLKLYLETFNRHELPRGELLKYIAFMLQDVERLSVNINSMLNLARIESRVYEKEFVLVDVIDTVRRFLAANRHIFKDSEIQVDAAAGQAIFHPIIVSLFEMLLMNILTNAVKYNASGSPRIVISFEEGRDSLFIRFRDNGIGLTKEEKKSIFKKFYQGHRPDNVTSGGSGIGLYLVQQIARLHRGKITADSEGEGKGSLFTLSLSYSRKEGDEG